MREEQLVFLRKGDEVNWNSFSSTKPSHDRDTKWTLLLLKATHSSFPGLISDPVLGQTKRKSLCHHVLPLSHPSRTCFSTAACAPNRIQSRCTPSTEAPQQALCSRTERDDCFPVSSDTSGGSGIDLLEWPQHRQRSALLKVTELPDKIC